MFRSKSLLRCTQAIVNTHLGNKTSGTSINTTQKHNLRDSVSKCNLEKSNENICTKGNVQKSTSLHQGNNVTSNEKNLIYGLKCISSSCSKLNLIKKSNSRSSYQHYVRSTVSEKTITLLEYNNLHVNEHKSNTVNKSGYFTKKNSDRKISNSLGNINNENEPPIKEQFSKVNLKFLNNLKKKHYVRSTVSEKTITLLEYNNQHVNEHKSNIVNKNAYFTKKNSDRKKSNSLGNINKENKPPLNEQFSRVNLKFLNNLKKKNLPNGLEENNKIAKNEGKHNSSYEPDIDMINVKGVINKIGKFTKFGEKIFNKSRNKAKNTNQDLSSTDNLEIKREYSKTTAAISDKSITMTKNYLITTHNKTLPSKHKTMLEIHQRNYEITKHPIFLNSVTNTVMNKQPSRTVSTIISSLDAEETWRIFNRNVDKDEIKKNKNNKSYLQDVPTLSIYSSKHDLINNNIKPPDENSSEYTPPVQVITSIYTNDKFNSQVEKKNRRQSNNFKRTQTNTHIEGNSFCSTVNDFASDACMDTNNPSQELDVVTDAGIGDQNEETNLTDFIEDEKLKNKNTVATKTKVLCDDDYNISKEYEGKIFKTRLLSTNSIKRIHSAAFESCTGSAWQNDKQHTPEYQGKSFQILENRKSHRKFTASVGSPESKEIDNLLKNTGQAEEYDQNKKYEEHSNLPFSFTEILNEKDNEVTTCPEFSQLNGSCTKMKIKDNQNTAVAWVRQEKVISQTHKKTTKTPSQAVAWVSRKYSQDTVVPDPMEFNTPADYIRSYNDFYKHLENEAPTQGTGEKAVNKREKKSEFLKESTIQNKSKASFDLTSHNSSNIVAIKIHPCTADTLENEMSLKNKDVIDKQIISMQCVKSIKSENCDNSTIKPLPNSTTSLGVAWERNKNTVNSLQPKLSLQAIHENKNKLSSSRPEMANDKLNSDFLTKVDSFNKTAKCSISQSSIFPGSNIKPKEHTDESNNKAEHITLNKTSFGLSEKAKKKNLLNIYTYNYLHRAGSEQNENDDPKLPFIDVEEKVNTQNIASYYKTKIPFMKNQSKEKTHNYPFVKLLGKSKIRSDILDTSLVVDLEKQRKMIRKIMSDKALTPEKRNIPQELSRSYRLSSQDIMKIIPSLLRDTDKPETTDTKSLHTENSKVKINNEKKEKSKSGIIELYKAPLKEKDTVTVQHKENEKSDSKTYMLSSKSSESTEADKTSKQKSLKLLKGPSSSKENLQTNYENNTQNSNKENKTSKKDKSETKAKNEDDTNENKIEQEQITKICEYDETIIQTYSGGSSNENKICTDKYTRVIPPTVSKTDAKKCFLSSLQNTDDTDTKANHLNDRYLSPLNLNKTTLVTDSAKQNYTTNDTQNLTSGQKSKPYVQLYAGPSQQEEADENSSVSSKESEDNKFLKGPTGSFIRDESNEHCSLSSMGSKEGEDNKFSKYSTEKEHRKQTRNEQKHFDKSGTSQSISKRRSRSAENVRGKTLEDITTELIHDLKWNKPEKSVFSVIIEDSKNDHKKKLTTKPEQLNISKFKEIMQKYERFDTGSTRKTKVKDKNEIPQRNKSNSITKLLTSTSSNIPNIVITSSGSKTEVKTFESKLKSHSLKESKSSMTLLRSILNAVLHSVFKSDKQNEISDEINKKGNSNKESPLLNAFINEIQNNDEISSDPSKFNLHLTDEKYPMINTDKTHLKYPVGSRVICHEDKNYKHIPSVSKILNETIPYVTKKVLSKWEEEKMNVLGGSGFEKYYKEQLKNDVEFHDCIRRHILGTPVSVMNTKYSTKGSLKSLKNVFSKISDITVLEMPVVHPELPYHGVVDCVARYEGEPVLIEWKQANEPKSYLELTYDAPVQLAAYIGAINYDVNYQLPIKSGLLAVSYTDGSPADVFRLSHEECKRYWKIWLGRLCTYMESKYAEDND